MLPERPDEFLQRQLTSAFVIVLPPAPTPTQLRPTTVGLAALGLLICTGGLSTYVALHDPSSSGSVSSATYTYAFSLVAVGGVIGLAAHLRIRCGTTWQQWVPVALIPVAAYVGWAMLSALWSVSPEATPSVTLIGVGIAAFGCWFGWTLRFDEQIWSLSLAMSVAIVTSVSLAVLVPNQGRMPRRGANPGGEWQGIFGNRNSLSPVCVLAIVSVGGLALLVRQRRVTVAATIIALLSLVALRESGGLTSTLALGFVILMAIVIPVIAHLKRGGTRGRTVSMVLTVVIAAVATFVFTNLDTLATRLGRDPTLSRRRWIWEDVRGFISHRPWQGYGFWAFWNRSDLTAATYARQGSAYASAHNSVLEVLLGLGIIGLIFYVAIGLFAILGIGAWVWREQSFASKWWAMVFVVIFAQNLMESFVLWHSYLWVLFIAAAIAPFGRATEPIGRGPIDTTPLIAADIVPGGLRKPVDVVL